MNIIKKLSIPPLSRWKGYQVLLVVCMVLWVVLLSCDLLNTAVISPGNVKATVEGKDSISISWSSSAGATSYNLYWSTTKGTGKSGTKIEKVESPYTHTGLEQNTIYYYVITAVDKNGKESGASTEVEAKTEIISPSNVQARAGGKDSISISWTDSAGATSYNLYWSTTKGKGKGGTKIEKATSPHTHTGVEGNTTYYYVVTAVNENGKETEASTEVEKNSPIFSGARNDDDGADFTTLEAEGNDNPAGLWSDGETMWVTDISEKKLYAYSMTTKKRDEDKEFTTLEAEGNENPTGIWSDGETMWVADVMDMKLYAYDMKTKARDTDKEFTTLRAAGNRWTSGIWSDGVTMWVADAIADKLYAYSMTTKKRDEDKDFNTLKEARNENPTGLWSDGETIWVADTINDKLYAYDMKTKERAETKDFTTTLKEVENIDSWGLWSDGVTMWVSNHDDNKIDDTLYAYELYK